MEYGYINENGYLVSRVIEDSPRSYMENGEVKSRMVSKEEQASYLIDEGWKPVDQIEDARLKTEEGYYIRVVPFDNGDRISFRYEKIFDERRKQNEINRLKEELTNSDYKIIKCYEANLIGEPLPYDITVLHTYRQELRDKINELQ